MLCTQAGVCSPAVPPPTAEEVPHLRGAEPGAHTHAAVTTLTMLVEEPGICSTASTISVNSHLPIRATASGSFPAWSRSLQEAPAALHG